MLNGIFDQTGYAATKRMLDATMLRQEAIASNLANAETPNYKRVDVDPSFSNALATALKTGQPSSLSAIEPKLVADKTAIATTPDGNNVQLEKEMMALNQNTLSHAVESHFLNGTLLKLRLAITGRS
jgi:flagellar basal-body rod protein FlgB